MRINVFISILVLFFLPAKAQQPFCNTLKQEISIDTMMRYVHILTGRQQVIIDDTVWTIASRMRTEPGNAIAAKFIRRTCLDFGYQVDKEPFSVSGENIIVVKQGNDPGNKAVIFCGHYDCVGLNGMPFQGADDNASGVAALLEMARVMKDTSFPYTVVFAFFDEEELGLLGSKAFAPSGPFNWDVESVVNMDMIGYDGNNDSIAHIHTRPVANSISLAFNVQSLNAKYQVGLHTQIINPGENSTDHRSFWDKDVTAVGLTEDYAAGFNPCWHQVCDTVGLLNASYFQRIAQLAMVTLCETAQGNIPNHVSDQKEITHRIFPNPFLDRIHISITDNRNEVQVKLYDMMGRVIAENNFTGEQGQLEVREDLPGGMYWLVLQAGNNFVQQKVMKRSF